MSYRRICASSLMASHLLQCFHRVSELFSVLKNFIRLPDCQFKIRAEIQVLSHDFRLTMY